MVYGFMQRITCGKKGGRWYARCYEMRLQAEGGTMDSAIRAICKEIIARVGPESDEGLRLRASLTEYMQQRGRMKKMGVAQGAPPVAGAE